MDRILEKSLSQIASRRSEGEKNYFSKLKNRYNLCPVTRRIVLRHLRQCESHRKKPSVYSYDTFISFAGEDKKIAERLSHFLRNKRKKKVFFSEEDIHTYNYSREIDDAIDMAENLIVVGTNPQHMKKPFVEFEWRSFLNDILNQRKREPFQLLSFYSFPEINLPRPLCMYTAVRFPPDDPEAGFEELARYI